MSNKEDTFMAGGIIAVLGLVALIFLKDLQAGFFLLGVGVVIMASVSEEFREKLFNFFFSIFSTLWEILKRISPM